SKIILIFIFIYLSAVGSVYASFTIEDERKVGREFYEKIDKSGVLYHDARIAVYINEVGNRILSTMPKSPFEYHFSVVKSSAVNAFATPGGYVYVNTGLINLVENESELAGVLSHEIGHVTARHVADIIEKSQKINIATLAAILAGAFLGGGGDATAAVAGFSMATATTLSLKYSREHEEEADRLGLSYLTQAGYDGTSMVDFLKIMRQYEFYSSNVPSYFLTHPGTDERIRYLDALLQTRYAKTGSKSIFGQLKRIQILLRLDQKNFDVSLKYFQAALEKKPDDVDYLYGLAVTQEQLGLIPLSLDTFQKALKQAPNDADVLQALGIACFKGGRQSEAIFYLSKALEIEKNRTDALLYLGKSYEESGKYDSALEKYKELEKKNSDDADVHFNLASVYGKTNNLGESHYQFGIYFKKKNKPESALFHFKEALKHFPPGSPTAQEIEAYLKAPKSPDMNNQPDQKKTGRN
ncbi:MAG: M48 family metalloprotease, partial [Syntrophales bacterium LBB04]|nr:M48 family metalloprotease [Syntrophales bacterium LBB04]